jgi:ATP-dependent Clp protease ATP-binding subunit ClpX
MFSRALRCSFCRRRDSQVNKLVAGPRVYICDRCAYETIRIMEADPSGPAKAPRQSMWTRLVQAVRAKAFLRTTSATSML